MDYRIIVETQRDGKEWFYVQKRFWLYFWRYISEVEGMDMCAYRIAFSTEEEAEKCIQKDVNYDWAEYQKKIVKRRVLDRNGCGRNNF